MELTTTPSLRPDSAACRRSQRGFTLIELLVVIGIIIALMSILLPALNQARKSSIRTSIASDLMGISQALDQYRNDFGDYPRPGMGNPIGQPSPAAATAPVMGAEVLCWALIGPGPATQDGADGPGFRLRGTQGKVYGPYLNVERYHYGSLVKPSGTAEVTVTPPAAGFDDCATVIADSQGNAILYFPGNTQVSPSAQGLVSMVPISSASAAPTAVYNYNDNTPILPGTSPTPGINLTPKLMAAKLGATSGSLNTAGGGTPVIAPFLLWSAGVDGTLGPQVQNGATTGDDDDVTYPELSAIGRGIAP